MSLARTCAFLALAAVLLGATGVRAEATAESQERAACCVHQVAENGAGECVVEDVAEPDCSKTAAGVAAELKPRYDELRQCRDHNTGQVLQTTEEHECLCDDGQFDEYDGFFPHFLPEVGTFACRRLWCDPGWQDHDDRGCTKCPGDTAATCVAVDSANDARCQAVTRAQLDRPSACLANDDPRTGSDLCTYTPASRTHPVREWINEEYMCFTEDACDACSGEKLTKIYPEDHHDGDDDQAEGEGDDQPDSGSGGSDSSCRTKASGNDCWGLNDLGVSAEDCSKYYDSDLEGGVDRGCRIDPASNKCDGFADEMFTKCDEVACRDAYDDGTMTSWDDFEGCEQEKADCSNPNVAQGCQKTCGVCQDHNDGDDDQAEGEGEDEGKADGEAEGDDQAEGEGEGEACGGGQTCADGLECKDGHCTKAACRDAYDDGTMASWDDFEGCEEEKADCSNPNVARGCQKTCGECQDELPCTDLFDDNKDEAWDDFEGCQEEKEGCDHNPDIRRGCRKTCGVCVDGDDGGGGNCACGAGMKAGEDGGCVVDYVDCLMQCGSTGLFNCEVIRPCPEESNRRRLMGGCDEAKCPGLSGGTTTFNQASATCEATVQGCVIACKEQRGAFAWTCDYVPDCTDHHRRGRALCG